ncbi:MAG: deoxyribodipyrimidine photo-lyase [Candidatus Puniceispirillaceae bacterium]
MADLVWLHEGALRRTHPVFAAAARGASAVFIWDDSRLTASHVGVKRRLFIYETLAELAGDTALEIHAGRAEEVLPRLAAARGVSRILMPASPDPAMLASFAAVSKGTPGVELTVIEDTPFVTLANPPDLGRFFRYWNKAKKGALRPHGG